MRAILFICRVGCLCRFHVRNAQIVWEKRLPVTRENLVVLQRFMNVFQCIWVTTKGCTDYIHVPPHLVARELQQMWCGSTCPHAGASPRCSSDNAKRKTLRPTCLRVFFYRTEKMISGMTARCVCAVKFTNFLWVENQMDTENETSCEYVGKHKLLSQLYSSYAFSMVDVQEGHLDEAKEDFLEGGGFTEEERQAREFGAWSFLTHRAFPQLPQQHVYSWILALKLRQVYSSRTKGCRQDLALYRLLSCHDPGQYHYNPLLHISVLSMLHRRYI